MHANDPLFFSAAAIVGPVTASIVFFGSSAVIIGLWPAHFIWTYYCVLKYGTFFPLSLAGPGKPDVMISIGSDLAEQKGSGCS